MNIGIAQEDMSVFSSDPAGVKERPGSPYYADGVDVGYTAPAKWWNWLWNHVTAWLTDSKADRTAMRTEMANVLTAASVSPSDSDSHQLSKAVNTVSYNTVEAYDTKEVTEEIGGVEVTHKKNQPYVISHTLYIPDTELL